MACDGTPFILAAEVTAALAGLRIARRNGDGNPNSEENPLGQACWRGQIPIARELLAHGAATDFRDGGCAIDAALHGSRHCQDPEGGPTMATVTEINPEERDSRRLFG